MSRALLLDEVGGFYRRSPEDCPTIRKKLDSGKVVEFSDKRRLGWRAVFRPIVMRDVASMIDGKIRIALGGLERVTLLVLDVDPGDKAIPVVSPQPAPAEDSLDEWRASKKARDRAKREEKRRAYEKQHDASRPVAVEAVRVMAERGFEAVLLLTRNGWHVVVLLRTPMSAAEANAVVKAWAAEVERNVSMKGVKLEAFPKIEGTGGRLCGLPFSEGQRWARCPSIVMGDDGRASVVGEVKDAERYKPRFSLRAEDVWTFLQRLVRPSPDALLKAFEVGQGAISVPPVERAPKGVVGVAEEGGYEKLYGYDFVCGVEARLARGLDLGKAWDQIRPVIAAFPYAGHTMAEMLRGMERWLRSGIHRARRCQSEAGIRELLSLCRTQYRYFERGLGNGTYLNGMNAPELRAELAELCGSRVRMVQRRMIEMPALQEAA